jgi:hypothetical protein
MKSDSIFWDITQSNLAEVQRINRPAMYETQHHTGQYTLLLNFICINFKHSASEAIKILYCSSMYCINAMPNFP